MATKDRAEGKPRMEPASREASPEKGSLEGGSLEKGALEKEPLKKGRTEAEALAGKKPAAFGGTLSDEEDPLKPGPSRRFREIGDEAPAGNYGSPEMDQAD